MFTLDRTMNDHLHAIRQKSLQSKFEINDLILNDSHILPIRQFAFPL